MAIYFSYIIIPLTKSFSWNRLSILWLLLNSFLNLPLLSSTINSLTQVLIGSCLAQWKSLTGSLGLSVFSLQSAYHTPNNLLLKKNLILSILYLKASFGSIAADMLGSYGSLARFRNISRIMRVNDSTMLGASGDYADFQYLKQVLGQMV